MEGEDDDELWIRAVALSLDGGLVVRRSAAGSAVAAELVGERLAAEMLEDGAADLLEERSP